MTRGSDITEGENAGRYFHGRAHLLNPELGASRKVGAVQFTWMQNPSFKL
jgi:hypothetical protein